MNDSEFFAQFDEFSGDVIAKLREALAVAIKDLKSSNSEMALAQMEILRARAAGRLKIDGDLDYLGRSEEHIAHVRSAVLAVIGHALDDATDFIVESDNTIFGTSDADACKSPLEDAAGTEDERSDWETGSKRGHGFEGTPAEDRSGWAN